MTSVVNVLAIESDIGKTILNFDKMLWKLAFWQEQIWEFFRNWFPFVSKQKKIGGSKKVLWETYSEVYVQFYPLTFSIFSANYLIAEKDSPIQKKLWREKVCGVWFFRHFGFTHRTNLTARIFLPSPSLKLLRSLFPLTGFMWPVKLFSSQSKKKLPLFRTLIFICEQSVEKNGG